MGGAQARRLCPDAIVVDAADVGLHRGEQGRVRGVRGHHAAGRGASRSTRRSSTSAGCGGSRGTPTEIAVRLRRDVRRAGRACRSRSASPGPSSSPRSRAAWPSRTACWSCRPTRELDFLHPLPVERLWGVGPSDRGQAARRAASAPWARSPGSAEAALVSILGPAAGRHLHALAAQPRSAAGAGRPPTPVDRLAARARPGRRSHPPTIDAVAGRARRPASPRRMRAADRVGRTVVLRLRFDDFTPGHPLAHAGRRPTADTETILATARGLLRAAMPMIEEPRADAGRHRGRQPRRRRRRPARAAVRAAAGGALDAALDARARAVRLAGRHPGGAARPRPRPVGPAATRLGRGLCDRYS